jgi:hypothetical protein
MKTGVWPLFRVAVEVTFRKEAACQIETIHVKSRAGTGEAQGDVVGTGLTPAQTAVKVFW